MFRFTNMGFITIFITDIQPTKSYIDRYIVYQLLIDIYIVKIKIYPTNSQYILIFGLPTPRQINICQSRSQIGRHIIFLISLSTKVYTIRLQRDIRKSEFELSSFIPTRKHINKRAECRYINQLLDRQIYSLQTTRQISRYLVYKQIDIIID